MARAAHRGPAPSHPLLSLLVVVAIGALGSTLATALGCRGPDPEGQPTASPAAASAPASAPTGSLASGPSTSDPSTAAPKPTWDDGWPPTEPFTSDERFDALIKGGLVLDGTGRPAVRADVLVLEGRIAHVGTVAPSVRVRREIDASGLIVAPGFIDAHSHGDPLASNDSFVAQGITTICIGQDGRSPSDDRIRYWAGRVGRKQKRLNVVPYVGHGTIRNLAGVGLSKTPTGKQLAKMAKLVGKEMDAGGWGLSTALEYTPGRFAPSEELVAIAKPVAERDGVVMSHMRSEDDDKIDEALDELIAQGKGSGARVHVAHIKVVYGKGAERAAQVLARMKAARDDGVQITADIYPYNASYTNISIVFPAFAKPPHKYKSVVRARRDELAAFLRERIARRGGPEATLFGNGPLAGKTLAQGAADLGKPFEDVLIDDIGPGGASAAYFVMNDALQSRMLLDPHVMIGTDGGSHSRHPRGHGTFAKVLREFVQKRKALPLEEAVRKMTGLTAQTVGLDRDKRGHLRAGWAADIVVFDPSQVVDRATYEHPSRRAEGMQWVLVNGRIVRKAGKATKARPGQVLLRGK